MLPHSLERERAAIHKLQSLAVIELYDEHTLHAWVCLHTSAFHQDPRKPVLVVALMAPAFPP